MASIRVIKNRIRSVGNTEQITKAMKMVSTSKLQKAKIKLEDARPFYQEAERVISKMIKASKGIHHPYLEQRTVKQILIILITGDRGLCGGFNVNVAKEARKLIRGDVRGGLIVVGTKGRDFFIRRKKTVIKTITGISENPFFSDAVEIGEQAIELYESGQYDKVYLVYTKFISTMSYEPKTLTLLPIDTERFKEDEGENASEKNTTPIMTYEPDEKTVLSYVIPKYINTMIYGALIESCSSQLSARMMGMDTATDNAEKLISSLTLEYNRARQGAITQELTEIVSGANALK